MPCIETAIASELQRRLSVHSCCRVQITVVDVAGRRHQLTALEGQTLVQVLQEHDELLGSDGASMAVLPLRLYCGMCHDRAAVVSRRKLVSGSASLQRAAQRCHIHVCCGSCLGLQWQATSSKDLESWVAALTDQVSRAALHRISADH